MIWDYGSFACGASRRPRSANVAAVGPVEVKDEEATGSMAEKSPHRQNLERLYQLSYRSSQDSDQDRRIEGLLGAVDKLGLEADVALSEAMQIPKLLEEMRDLTKSCKPGRRNGTRSQKLRGEARSTKRHAVSGYGTSCSLSRCPQRGFVAWFGCILATALPVLRQRTGPC
jgi:hypothetical protein